MYVIAIGWLFVTVLMAATEPNFTAGALTFIAYGLLPLALLLWLLGTPQRGRRRAWRQMQESTGADDPPPASVNAGEAAPIEVDDTTALKK